jgi:O-antigen ligase
MRWLIASLIVILALSDLLGLDLSLAPGVSVKNGLVYLLAVVLVLRLAIEGEARLELGGVHVAFAILIAYAILTWLLAAIVIEYPGYRFLDSAIGIKTRLVDPAVFFFACFHGARTLRDAGFIVRTLALAVIVANTFTLTDVIGWTDFGMRIGARGAEFGRVFGAFGHANDTAALLVALLPAMVALALSARGVARVLWYAGALVSGAVLLMTVSRGAYVAVVVGGLWAAWLCRHAIPARQFARMGFAILAATVLLVVVVSIEVGDVLSERIFGQSGAIDLDDASSGRTEIWQAALGRMLDAPLSLITGFGWGVYETMPFRYATHNYYLGVWFELGLIGLAALLVILTICVRTARAAFGQASGERRRLLVAFVFGLCAVSIAVFFTDLNSPWLYIWSYVGASMRMALLAERVPAASRPRRVIAEEPVAGRRPVIFDRKPTT